MSRKSRMTDNMTDNRRQQFDAGVFKPWFISFRTVACGLFFILLAVAGYSGSRVAMTGIKFARINAITEKSVVDDLQSNRLTEEEIRAVSAMGSKGAAETLYLPPVLVLNVLACGHHPALADLLFIRAHAWFLSHFFTDRRFIWLTNYFDAITGLDPDNPKVYLWAAQVIKLGQMIDDDIIFKANNFLKKGLERFPRDWRMHLDMGFNLYFEFKGATAEEKSLSKLRARDYFATAAGLPGAVIDPNFVAELFQRDHEDSLAIAYALQKYYEATEDQREQLLRRISVLSDALADGIRQEEKRWRSGASHMPVTLFALLDDRPDSMWELLFKKNAAVASSKRAVRGNTPLSHDMKDDNSGPTGETVTETGGMAN